MAIPNPTFGSSSARFAVDDLSFDLVSCLYEHSKSLEVYEKHIKDAGNDSKCRQLLEEIRQSDFQFCQRLQRCLSQQLADTMQKENAA